MYYQHPYFPDEGTESQRLARVLKATTLTIFLQGRQPIFVQMHQVLKCWNSFVLFGKWPLPKPSLILCSQPPFPLSQPAWHVSRALLTSHNGEQMTWPRLHLYLLTGCPHAPALLVAQYFNTTPACQPPEILGEHS